MQEDAEMKKLLVDHLYAMIAGDRETLKELGKEFHLPEEKLEGLVKRFLELWLKSPEMIALLSELLGVYGTGEAEKGGHKYYIG